MKKKNKYQKKMKANRVIALVIIVSMVLFTVITAGVALLS